MLIPSTEERITEMEGNDFVEGFFFLAIVQEIPIMTPGVLFS